MKKVIKGFVFYFLVLIACFFIRCENIRADTVPAYSYGTTGDKTSINASKDTAFLDYTCVKTYADGRVTKNKFRYYLTESGSINPIPGLINTNVMGTNCDTMVPQGICKMGSYTLITAYDSEKKCNSVIYALNSSGVLLATIVLPSKIHVGGIIFDGKHVWICNGSTTESDKYVYYYTKSQIEKAISYCYSGNYKSIRINENGQRINIGLEAAYCTYFEGLLWFGEFNGTGVATIKAYSISYTSSGTPMLTNVGDMQAPQATQGMTFYRYSGKVYLIFSQSYGRNETKKVFLHKLIVYTPTDFDILNCKGGTNRDYHKGNRTKDILIPEMSENVCMGGSVLYLIFESGAKVYTSNEKDRVEKNHVCDKFCRLDFYKVAVE